MLSVYRVDYSSRVQNFRIFVLQNKNHKKNFYSCVWLLLARQCLRCSVLLPVVTDVWHDWTTTDSFLEKGTVLWQHGYSYACQYRQM